MQLISPAYQMKQIYDYIQQKLLDNDEEMIEKDRLFDLIYERWLLLVVRGFLTNQRSRAEFSVLYCLFASS
jgi:hypothetical protein